MTGSDSDKIYDALSVTLQLGQVSQYLKQLFKAE